LCPLIQPGIKIRHVKGQPGTFGAFALHHSGRVVLIGAEHTITNHWRARLGDPLILQPTDSASQATPSLRIKEIREDLPAVLKKPANPVEGMSVVKFGWKTKKTVGRILHTNSSTNILYQDGKQRKLDDLIAVEIEADHGDSGSILLSVGNHKPLGFLEARHEIYSNICYFVKARTLARKLKLLGFFCPMEIPRNCPEMLKTVIKSMIPDGYFEQTGECMDKDWRRVAGTIGLDFPGIEQVEPFDFRQSEAERSLKLGQEIRYLGRLIVDRQNRLVGLVHASSEHVSVGIQISKIEAALSLRLIGAFGW